MSGTTVWCTILLREKSCIFNSSLTALFQVALSETFMALQLTSSLNDWSLCCLIDHWLSCMSDMHSPLDCDHIKHSTKRRFCGHFNVAGWVFLRKVKEHEMQDCGGKHWPIIKPLFEHVLHYHETFHYVLSPPDLVLKITSCHEKVPFIFAMLIDDYHLSFTFLYLKPLSCTFSCLTEHST